MSTPAELGMPTATVTPGGEATTTLTVRNDTDIVEAYTLEVVGNCAAWSTVEPTRVSLYPGTSETVTVRLTPPRSPEVRAGEMPLAVRVLPAERPELVTVPETTVLVEAFQELRIELEPRRRRGWRRARYRTAINNQGNTPVAVAPLIRQPGEELRAGFTPSQPPLEPGESADVLLRLRHRKLIWFGKPVTWPFDVEVNRTDDDAAAQGAAGVVPGEFVQLPVLPKWLLALLAVLAALVLAWFLLVGPSVRSTAKQAAESAVSKQASGQPTASTGPSNGSPTGPSTGQHPGGGQPTTGTAGAQPVPGTGQQSSATVEVHTASGATKVGTYRVPAGKILGITDIVVANFQGDEGLLTISFGNDTITTIALETFRNQDYHWVTPIEVPQNESVTASVTCTKPGTPASGKQASECTELLNVDGVLSDIKQ